MPDLNLERSSAPLAMPMIGLGTFGKQGDVGFEAMLAALEMGYRHIDTAQGYGNEENVGRALKQSLLPRVTVHLTTKIDMKNLARDRLRPSLERSLEKLGTDYVDLTLIHWPSPQDAVPMSDYLEALVRCQEEGLTRAVGVSNFTRALLDEAVATVGSGVIRNNQVEVQPFLQNRLVREKCAELGIPVTGYMPVAGGEVMRDETIKRIAGKHSISPSQVAIAWLVQHGIAAIPSSMNAVHLAENLKAGDFTLSPEDMSAIDSLDRGYRIIVAESIAPEWDD